MPERTDQQRAVESPVRWSLIKAIEKHDEEEVRRLIAEGVDVSEVDNQIRSPLICAVENNVDLDIIRVLVEEGKAAVNAKDPRYGNRTSLFYAVTKSKETASYLFGEARPHFNKSDVPRILAFYIENLCTTRNMHDSGPTVADIFRILRENNEDLTPTSLASDLAKSIANILLCNCPLLLTSDSHRPQNDSHSMFHLHEKRNFLLDTLEKVSECECFKKNYPNNEGIKEVLRMIRERRNQFSVILDLLKEHRSDPNFADSYGNTALHYAACLPWMGVSQETTEDICTQLYGFGVPLDAKNHQGQTPLLFCLSGSMGHLEEKEKVTAVKTLVEVCKFLVKLGSVLVVTSKNGESVFHLVMKLFQQGLEILDQTIRKDVIDETMKFMDWFTRSRVGKIVQERGGDLLNSPLHLWASLALTESIKDYTSFVTQEHTFSTLLEVIFKHLVKCGALKNDRNKEEETPLHVCTTWSAVTLLIGVGANRNDWDSEKRPPLLAAAKKKTFLRNPSRFYPDVQEDANSFFKKAAEKEKLDPWAFHKCDESVLGFLIASDTYDLSKALVEVACGLKEDKCREIFVSLLKAICKDKSPGTKWKIELVETILECAKERKMNVVKEPFDVCCDTLSELINGPSLSRNEITKESGDMVDNAQACSNNGHVDSDDPDDDKPSPPDIRLTEESGGVTNGDEPPPPNSRTAMQSAQIESTIHCQIAKMLRSYGAELSGQPYETLKTKCNEIDNILQGTKVEVLVPWTSRSERHRTVLEKVARRQESHEIGESICCHRLPNGSFGADPLVGINKLNSREVAIKCIGEAQCTQDLKNLYAELDCEQIIRYFLHLEDNVDEIVYIVFELMEGNLDEYLEGDAFDSSKGTSLCQDIVKGLNYLHKKDVRHFKDHLKPTSIFYKTHPDLCLKITDFDHQPTNGTTICVWSSPEVLRGVPDGSKTSDVFCCGLLLHYILSRGEHPFSTGCTNSTETESNIKDNKWKMDDSLSPEGAHLVKEMFRDENHRPTTMKALNHPLFWSKTIKLDLLIAVGNQPEMECPRAKRTPPLTAVEIDFEAQFGTIVKYAEWNDPRYVHMPAIHTEMTRRRGYDVHSVVELVRFIRNAIAHVSESTRSTAIRKQILEDFVFLEYFPNLVMEVYKAVATHGWDQKREEIKYALKK